MPNDVATVHIPLHRNCRHQNPFRRNAGKLDNWEAGGRRQMCIILGDSSASGRNLEHGQSGNLWTCKSQPNSYQRSFAHLSITPIT